jgi:hypothetical protein
VTLDVEYDMKSPGMRTQTWLALVVVLVGLASIAIGVSLLLPGSSQVVAGWLVTPTWTASPTATQTATQVPTRTPAATWTSQPTATSTPAHTPRPTPVMLAAAVPTPTPMPKTASESEGAPEGAVLALTIVHTNDTWGYTRPCG